MHESSSERKTTKKRQRLSLHLLQQINLEIFLSTLALYAILQALETIKHGCVDFFFNSDILLYIVLFTGIILAITIIIGALRKPHPPS